MRRLLEAGITVHRVTHVCISHFHPDHTGELAPFIFANKYPDVARRQTPLTLIGGPGFDDFLTRLKGVYGRWIQLDGDLVRTVEAEVSKRFIYHGTGWQLEMLPVAHNPESVAFRLAVAGGPSVVYSGDTDYSENLVTLARDTDLLVCEAARPDEHAVPGHLTPSLAGRVAAEACARKLMLTHFYPDCEGVDLAAQCRRTYAGPVVLAHDLLRIEVR
jgi:ribonuclease BN (tRNA processing enzyme)